ncbi:hypothetical protein [Paenibacillus taiwanensis]|uniref:hypothetical protein n=1 Tax=Paenibacillus taiwanensis TaxID=401638 RepID=UPI00040E9C0B|nr:hypothetical protein [Paenibacillus taiwanensis]
MECQINYFRRDLRKSDGTKVAKTLPVQVKDILNISKISVGFEHMVALNVNGELWSWGANFFGTLGDGTNTSRVIPAQIKLN